MRWSAPVSLAFVAATLTASSQRPLAAGAPACPRVIGLTVEAVDTESAGGRAGIDIGDLLVSWCRPAPNGECAHGGELQSVLGWWDVEMDIVQRGGVRLVGRHGGSARTWAAFQVYGEGR